ncbi:hypothetical protein FHK92_19485, partial [Pseudomonas brassicacearum subsp. neoaurantiaca]|nr:hypothetical protein [Pseudomonas brassicacearum subsp. neoaurantiaca]
MKPSHLLLIWLATLLPVGTVLGALRALGVARAAHRGAFGGPGAAAVDRSSLGVAIANAVPLHMLAGATHSLVARELAPAGLRSRPQILSGTPQGEAAPPAGASSLATVG